MTYSLHSDACSHHALPSVQLHQCLHRCEGAQVQVFQRLNHGVFLGFEEGELELLFARGDGLRGGAEDVSVGGAFLQVFEDLAYSLSTSVLG